MYVYVSTLGVCIYFGKHCPQFCLRCPTWDRQLTALLPGWERSCLQSITELQAPVPHPGTHRHGPCCCQAPPMSWHRASWDQDAWVSVAALIKKLLCGLGQAPLLSGSLFFLYLLYGIWVSPAKNLERAPNLFKLRQLLSVHCSKETV